MVREDMILAALSKEMDAQAKEAVVLSGAMLAGLVKDRKTHVDTIFRDLTDYRRLLELDVTFAQEEQRTIERLTSDPVVNRLMAKLKDMKESGKYAELTKRAHDKIKAYEAAPMKGFQPGENTKFTMSKNDGR